MASGDDQLSWLPTRLAVPSDAVTPGSISASSSMSLRSSVNVAGSAAVYGTGPGFVTVIVHVTWSLESATAASTDLLITRTGSGAVTGSVQSSISPGGPNPVGPIVFAEASSITRKRAHRVVPGGARPGGTVHVKVASPPAMLAPDFSPTSK